MSGTPPRTPLDRICGAGSLNPACAADTNTHVRRETTTGFGTLREIIDDRFKKDLTAGVERYRAIVLHVKGQVVSAGKQQVGGTAQNMNDMLYGQASKSRKVQIKAVIPELDPRPLPIVLPNDQSQKADWERIRWFPTFTATNASVPRPKPGDIVWVTFEDRINFKNGVYLAPDIVGSVEPALTAETLKTFKKECEFCAAGPEGEELGVEAWRQFVEAANVIPVNLNVSATKGTIPVGKGVFTGLYSPTLQMNPIEDIKNAFISWVCFRDVDIPDEKLSSGEFVKPIGEQKIVSPIYSSGMGQTKRKTKQFVDKYHKNGIKAFMLARAPNLIVGLRPHRNSDWKAGGGAKYSKILDNYADKIVDRAAELGVIGIVIEVTDRTGYWQRATRQGIDPTLGAAGGGENLISAGSVAMPQIEELTHFWKRVFNNAKKTGMSVGLSISNFEWPSSTSQAASEIGRPKGWSNFANLPWKHFSPAGGNTTGADFVIHNFAAVPEYYMPKPDVQQAEGDPTGQGGAGRNIGIPYYPGVEIQAKILKQLGFKNMIPGLSSGRWIYERSDLDKDGRFSTTILDDQYSNIAQEMITIGGTPYHMRQMTMQIAAAYPNAAGMMWKPWAPTDVANESSLLHHKQEWGEKRWDVLKELGDLVKRLDNLNKLDSATTTYSDLQKSAIRSMDMSQYLTGIVTEYKRFRGFGRTQLDLHEEGDGKGPYVINRKNIFLPAGYASIGETMDSVIQMSEMQGKEKREAKKRGLFDIPLRALWKDDGGFYTYHEFFGSPVPANFDEEITKWETKTNPHEIPTTAVADAIQVEESAKIEDTMTAVYSICEKYAQQATGG